MSPSIHISERTSTSSSTSDVTATTSASSTTSFVANFWLQSAPQYVNRTSTTSSDSRPRDHKLEATLDAWSWDQPIRQVPEPRRGPRDELIPGADEQMCERKRETKLAKMRSKLPGAGRNFSGRSPFEKKSWYVSFPDPNQLERVLTSSSGGRYDEEGNWQIVRPGSDTSMPSHGVSRQEHRKRRDS